MVHERQCGAIVMLSGPVEEGMVGSRGSLINHALSERTNTVWLVGREGGMWQCMHSKFLHELQVCSSQCIVLTFSIKLKLNNH